MQILWHVQISVQGATTAKFNKQEVRWYSVLVDSIPLPFSNEICQWFRRWNVQTGGHDFLIHPLNKNTYGIKTNWCHYFNFIHILPDLYMFRAHRPIFRRVRTAVYTTIGSYSFCAALFTCSAREQSGTDTEPMVVWTAVRTLLKMGLWDRNM